MDGRGGGPGRDGARSGPGLSGAGSLGGAAATHARIGSPLLTHPLFGVHVGILTWAGLRLRDPRLRALLPVRSGR